MKFYMALVGLIVAITLSACSAATDDVVQPESDLVPAAVVIRSGSVAAFVENVSLVASAEFAGNQILVEVDGANIGIVGVAAASHDAPSQVFVGQALKLSATDLEPNSLTEAWLFSTPTLLGVFSVDGEGVLSASLVIGDAVEVGQHQLQIRSVSRQGRKVVVALNVSLQAEATPAGQDTDSGLSEGSQQATRDATAPQASADRERADTSPVEGRQREQTVEQGPSANVGRVETGPRPDQQRAREEAAARERAEEERQAAERAETARVEAERAAAEREEAERRAAARQAAEEEAARRAAADAESEVLAAARTHAEAVTQQEAGRVAARRESQCRSTPYSPVSCPGSGRRAGEAHYAENIGPNLARFEYEFMARDYNAVYERYLREYLAAAG